MATKDEEPRVRKQRPQRAGEQQIYVPRAKRLAVSSPPSRHQNCATPAFPARPLDSLALSASLACRCVSPPPPPLLYLFPKPKQAQQERQQQEELQKQQLNVLLDSSPPRQRLATPSATPSPPGSPVVRKGRGNFTATPPQQPSPPERVGPRQPPPRVYPKEGRAPRGASTHVTGERGASAHATGERGPSPQITRERGAVPQSTGERGPSPQAPGERGPLPHATHERGPSPCDVADCTEKVASLSMDDSGDVLSNGKDAGGGNSGEELEEWEQIEEPIIMPKEQPSPIRSRPRVTREEAEQINGPTRMLEVYDFPAAYNSSTLHKLFEDYVSSRGGYRIKWVSDTSAIVIFASAITAKAAYVNLLDMTEAKIRPYNGLMPLNTNEGM
ncbi:hypothetical protein BDK51DRAFT_39575 [Blyttiomyces helicus]|uniref:Uncharacterized protein n=1 Tax=Blyttiomyces helicus TaxID=388810 RepID=A0A4P9W8Y2_9FUNG|nr:hypothetical protein BDK51DRAFT_39575 [Blyttiomyces helicus]|eukprot:RKO87558.1 hypothetical protein BDK51DRAFT_39575 [Blyttiomyces helicus]